MIFRHVICLHSYVVSTLVEKKTLAKTYVEEFEVPERNL